MGDTFDSKGGGQNIAQGKNAIGKQENATQPVSGDGHIFSGTGNVTVNQGLRVKPRTVLLASVLAAAVLGASVAGWHLLAPEPPPAQQNSIVIKDNQYSGPTAIAQGAGAAVTQTNNYSGGYNVSLELFEKYVKDLNVTDVALVSFFKIMEKAQVPRADLDSKLREIAATHKELLARLDSVKSEDPQVVKLKQEAKQAIEVSDYAKAEELLNQAEALDLKAIEQMEKTAKQRRISAAATNADQARLQEVQLHYAKAAEYWQKALKLDPDNADGWNQLGILLLRTGELAQAEAAYRKVLSLGEAHQDKEEQAMAFGNLGIVYRTRGDMGKAEEMHSKVLALHEALGSKEGMAADYGNLGSVAYTRGDMGKAEEMHSKALALYEALGSKEGMAKAYGNLGSVAYTRGDLDKAEEMYRKSLAISEALGLKEATASQYGNLGIVYQTRGDLDKAEEMYKKSLAISEALGLKEATANQYGNLGSVAYTRGDLDKAEEMYRKGLELDEALGSKEGMAAKYGNLGNVHKQRGDLAQAEAAWKKSLRLYQEMGAMQHEGAKKVQQWLDKLARQKGSSR